MKFGLIYAPSWPEQDASQQSRIFGEMIEQVQFAEQLGFDAVWLTEQHFTLYSVSSSPLPLATYVAAHTKKIRIGTAVVVLTIHDPIMVAEEAALVDVLSNGRLDFGVGRGSTRYEYGNFNVDFETRTKRFQESLDIILGLWTTQGFTYQGDFYQLDDVSIAPSPIQKPRPPVYMAVALTPSSADMAISMNLPILNAYITPEKDALALRSYYLEQCKAVGKTPPLEQVPFFRIAYVAEDEKTAKADLQKRGDWVFNLHSKRSTLTKGSEIHTDLEEWRRTHPGTSQMHAQVPQDLDYVDSRLEAAAYYGTPDTLIQRISWLQKEHNVQNFVTNMAFAGMEHAKVMRSMELFAKEVMPKFR
jgi:alkanesulfonate monooxygenase SsuD/methylene tetrahydromethanopterin reductase-like flavin-dependent oxidoreductase (luciferase family)